MRRARGWQTAAGAVAAAALALSVGACGGDDKSATAGAGQEQSSGGPSEDLIRERSAPPVEDFAPEEDKLLPKEKVIMESALGVNLTRQSVTLPLHKGEFRGETAWYVITEASDAGLANDLDVNFSSKLANMGIGCPRCVQDVTLTGLPKNAFGEGIVHFEGVPDFTPDRSLEAGPAADPKNAFPPATAQPGAVADKRYSPFIRFKGSSVVYNAPIIAMGDGPFDVTTHKNTADRVLAMTEPADPQDTPSGQFKPGTVEMLLVHGLQSDQDIFYMSTEASDAVAATLERATFVPALNKAPVLGADDFLGSARERIFLFTNGQSGPDNPESQGLSHLITDGLSSQDANLENTELLNALVNQDGDALNVLGDFPSLSDPRHANAYSPLWDAQVGTWTDKAIREKLNKRQTDENRILNLAAKRPDLLTGPLGAPYGAAGFVINCPTIAFTKEEPVIAAVAPEAGGQF
ncbi:MAG: hypothetical protein H0V42_13070 [Nocardioidaceae bacterium]|nr:hypothetical protein [Nocardioidaceae bacterium]